MDFTQFKRFIFIINGRGFRRLSKFMAQKIIRLGFPKAAQEYKAGQLDQLVNTLEQMILQLNNTFSNNIPEENAEQQGWFFK